MSNINFFRIMVGIATPYLAPTSRPTDFRYGLTVGKPVLECETSRLMNVTIYSDKDPTQLLPANGDTVYTTATGNNYLANGNYALSITSRTGTPTSIITITGGAGLITSAQLCIA